MFGASFQLLTKDSTKNLNDVMKKALKTLNNYHILS